MLRGRASWPLALAEETVDAVEESRRRPVGFGSERAVGLRPATGRAEAARPRRSSAPCPGPAATVAAGRIFLWHRHRTGAGGRVCDLGEVRRLFRPVRRARRLAAFRPICAGMADRI